MSKLTRAVIAMAVSSGASLYDDNPKLSPYANLRPKPRQELPEFNQEMYDKLEEEVELIIAKTSKQSYSQRQKILGLYLRMTQQKEALDKLS